MISEHGFEAWAEDPAEDRGKGVASKSTMHFFTWMRETEGEGDEDEWIHWNHKQFSTTIYNETEKIEKNLLASWKNRKWIKEEKKQQILKKQAASKEGKKTYTATKFKGNPQKKPEKTVNVLVDLLFKKHTMIIME